MKIRLLSILLGVAFIFSFSSCNPDCETAGSGNFIVPQGPYQQGSQLAISANPPDLLRGRSFSVGFSSGGQTTIEPLQTDFEPALGASVVTMPDNLNQNATLFIDDPDCSGNLIPVTNSSSVVTPDFFDNNPLFVTPIPPIVIIPAPPVNPPLKVINAWFSPNDRQYCLWFLPERNADGSEGKNLVSTTNPNAIRGIPDPLGIEGNIQNFSVELAAGCSGFPAADDRLYHRNPVSGIVDKENNYIRISIDRSAKGLGVEEYEGQFINPGQLVGTTYAIGGACAPDGSSKPNIMLLTSLKTGRQLVLFRNND